MKKYLNYLFNIIKLDIFILKKIKNKKMQIKYLFFVISFLFLLSLPVY
jgi:hypothetical protein